MTEAQQQHEAALKILDLEMGENDADAPTVREYLGALLMTLWTEGESFSGKRPFGNSGWEYDLYKPLIKAGLVDGRLDSGGYIDTVDEVRARKLIDGAIVAALYDR